VGCAILTHSHANTSTHTHALCLSLSLWVCVPDGWRPPAFPIRVEHASRALAFGSTTLYLYVPVGVDKETWLIALRQAAHWSSEVRMRVRTCAYVCMRVCMSAYVCIRSLSLCVCAPVAWHKEGSDSVVVVAVASLTVAAMGRAGLPAAAAHDGTRTPSVSL
jgi:hypothetical protein